MMNSCYRGDREETMRRVIPLMNAAVFMLVFWWGGHCSPVQAQSAIMVDTRLMVMAHPMTNRFDPSTRRFKDSSSEPLAEGETKQSLESMIGSLERQLAELQTKFGGELKQASRLQRPLLEKAYLERRRELETRLKEQKERKFCVEEVPLHPGMTSYDAIQPQVQTISNDLQMAVRRLREKYQAAAVVDISSLLPLFPPQGNPEILRQNCHFYFWRNSFPKNGNISQEWMLQAKRYWAHRDSQSTPVPYGASDVRFEGAQIMAGERRK